MSDNETPTNHKKVMDKIQSSLDSFVRKVHNTDQDLCVTGFIYGMSPPMLFHFGNINNSPEEIFDIHQRLGYLFASQSLEGKLNKDSIDVDIEVPCPEDIADQLAVKLLESPELAEDVRDTVLKYISARRASRSQTLNITKPDKEGK